MVEFRLAIDKDATILTNIAFSSKRSWNYPESYFEIWANELTITKEYIEKNMVYIAVDDDMPIGFFSIVTQIEDKYFGDVLVEKGFWLDHFFVLPKHQRRGVGTTMMKFAVETAKDAWIEKLKIFVDPNAVKFYKKMGATFVRDSNSSIKDRKIPIYELIIDSEL